MFEISAALEAARRGLSAGRGIGRWRRRASGEKASRNAGGGECRRRRGEQHQRARLGGGILKTKRNRQVMRRENLERLGGMASRENGGVTKSIMRRGDIGVVTAERGA